MGGRSRWVLIGGGALLILGLAAHMIAGHEPSPPLRVFFASAGGGVLFPHARHVEQGPACAQCHHEMAGGEPQSCLSCHHAGSFDLTAWEDSTLADVHAEMLAGGEAGVCLGCHVHGDLSKPLRPASQSTCANCHEADLAALQGGHSCSSCHAVEEGAQVRACRVCHQTGEGEAKSCEDCHAGSGYTGDMMEHAELTAIEGHTCSACHVATRLGDAMHHQCTRCHLDLEQGTYFTRSKDDETTVCGTCHMKS